MAGLTVQNAKNDLLYIGFNQDFSCFAAGTQRGFHVFNCDPFKERCRRDFGGQGVGHVEMLFRCNILALAGGGRNPKWDSKKVQIWDDQRAETIGHVGFRHDVKAIRLRRDRVVVVTEYKIYVHNIANLQLLQEIDTAANPKGICAVCATSAHMVLAAPAAQRGYVRVELYTHKKVNNIKAHQCNLSCLALNADGSRLATASQKGTIIRLFDTFTGQALRELRRGSHEAVIHSIAFNATSQWLCSSSDTGTMHIFNLAAAPGTQGNGKSGGGGADGKGGVEDAEASPSGNGGGSSNGALAAEDGGHAVAPAPAKGGGFGFMKSLLPNYFSSEWSFAQFRVPCKNAICCFGNDDKNSIIVLTETGMYYQASFDPVAGGDCVQESFQQFVGAEDDMTAGGPQHVPQQHAGHDHRDSAAVTDDA